MKNKRLFLRGKTYGLLLAASLFLFGSCTVGLHEEGEFNPGVSNTILSAPEVTARANADGSQTELSWPVVMGAGGYELTLYDINDPDNPRVVVVEKAMESSEEDIPDKVETIIYENYFVDGSIVLVPRYEDTNYKLLIKSLGNPKYNNKDSETKEVLFTSIVPKLNDTPIPAGTDLTQWFAENQTLINAQTEEFALELTGGETYKMSGPVNLGNHLFTLRSSDKTNLPTIEMEATASFVTETGLKIKYVNLDCTNMTDKNSSIIAYAKEPTIAKTQNHYLIPKGFPVVLQNCYVKNLKTHLFYDNDAAWAVYTQMIKNCVIELDQKTMDSNDASVAHNNKGFCFDFEVLNSTIYSTTSSSKTFLVSYSSTRPNQICNGMYPTNDVKILNSTFVNVSNKNYIANYGRLAGQKMCQLTIADCIFVDSSKDAVARGFMANGNDNMTWSITNCCYWYNGKIGDTGRPKGTRVEADPQLTQTAKGYYTVGGAEVKAAGCGDPRGLQ